MCGPEIIVNYNATALIYTRTPQCRPHTHNTIEEEGAKAAARATTDAVEAEETLETSAAVGEFAQSVKDQVDNFLANGVVTTGVQGTP